MEGEDLEKKVHSLWIQRAICDRIKQELAKVMEEIVTKVQREVEQILCEDQEKSGRKKEESKESRTALYTPNWEELQMKVEKVVLEGVKGMIKREEVLTETQATMKKEKQKSELRILALITNYEKGFGLYFQDKLKEAHSLWKEVEEGMKTQLGKDHPHTQWANEAVRLAKSTIKRHNIGDQT